MPHDAGREHNVHRSFPPSLGKNLDFGQADVAGRLYLAANARKIDDTVAHHAAVIQHMNGWKPPVADVDRE
jgi:hypothetical protein